MKKCDFGILCVLSLAIAVVAETQPIYFEAKTDCLKSLPPGKTDEFCIKCQPFLGCTSGSKWIIRSVRSRRIAKAAGVDKGKCSADFYMDATGTCVPVFQIPISTGGAIDQLFKTTTTITTTTSTSVTHESVVNIVSSMPTTTSQPSSTYTTTLSLTILIFWTMLKCSIVCLFLYIFFSYVQRLARRIRRQRSQESCTEHSIA